MDGDVTALGHRQAWMTGRPQGDRHPREHLGNKIAAVAGLG